LASFGPAAAGAPLLRNSRKTECGAGLFLARLAVRAAPFALNKFIAAEVTSTVRRSALIKLIGQPRRHAGVKRALGRALAWDQIIDAA
jgi:hypothetical protein